MGIYDFRKDLPIRIRKDARQAGRVYKEITVKEGTRVYYLYVVGEGDTLKSIARKFYGSEATVARALKLSSHVRVRPGEIIKIELE